MKSPFKQEINFSVHLTVPEVIMRLQDLIETQNSTYYGSVKEQLDRVKKAFNGIPSVYTYPSHHETLLTGGHRKWYGGSVHETTFNMYMLYRTYYRLVEGKKIKSRAPLTPAESIFPVQGKLIEDPNGTKLVASARMPFYHIAFVLFFYLLCGIGIIGTLMFATREGFTQSTLVAFAFLAGFMSLPYFMVFRSFKANVKNIEEDLKRLFADKLV
ncbi:hypothetical protein [Rufibacter roseus]|uniref:Uncharacterized protein n=1 Tax=Rufibacter roseus TaxID=1567108 RepID=A0ABW2DIW9_9BACT|nr:hypothetical protein [Rufibacter roseus]